jgi:hypothetical protein
VDTGENLLDTDGRAYGIVPNAVDTAEPQTKACTISAIVYQINVHFWPIARLGMPSR